MRARRVITALAALVWAVMTGLTGFVLFTAGPDVLVFLSLVVCVLLGAAVVGAVQEARR